MALHATAKAVNVAKSVYARLGPLLAAQGLTVDYEGYRQDLTSASEWVQMRLLDAGGGDYAGWADADRRGAWKQALLSFNVFVKQPLSNAYRPRTLRDVILGQVEIWTTFDLKDYEAGAMSVGSFRVLEVLDDRRIPNDKGWHQHNLTLRLEWLEKF